MSDVKEQRASDTPRTDKAVTDREAADAMARDAIRKCNNQTTGGCGPYMGKRCYELINRTCALRLFLASHGHADAWEVK